MEFVAMDVYGKIVFACNPCGLSISLYAILLCISMPHNGYALVSCRIISSIEFLWIWILL
jgi:hypothetical protein